MRAWAFLVTSNDYYGRAAYPEWVYAAHFDANLRKIQRRERRMLHCPPSLLGHACSSSPRASERPQNSGPPARVHAGQNAGRMLTPPLSSLTPNAKSRPRSARWWCSCFLSLTAGDSALICGAIRPKERAGDRAQRPVDRWKQDGSSTTTAIYETLFAALPDFEIFKRVFSLAEIIRPQR